MIGRKYFVNNTWDTKLYAHKLSCSYRIIQSLKPIENKNISHYRNYKGFNAQSDAFNLYLRIHYGVKLVFVI